MERVPPSEPPEEPTLQTPKFQIPDCGRINFCYFSFPICVHLLRQPLETLLAVSILLITHKMSN